MNADPTRVLLIEDNPIDARVIQALAGKHEVPFEIVWADRLASGVARLAEGAVDVVLLDLSLPDSAGLDTFFRLQEQAPEVPIIVLTSTDDDRMALKAVQAGAQDYLVKGRVDRHLILRTARYAIERKRAARALRDSEERYRDLFENAPIGIFRTAPDGRILMSNPALVKLLGYDSFAELAAHNLEREGWGFNNPRPAFRELIEAEGEVRGLESVWLRRDGTPIYVRENAILVRGPDGRTLYYEGTIEDITERRHAEEALRESEERYRSVIAALEEGIMLLDPEGTILACNTSAEKILGFSAEQLIGKTSRDPRWQTVHEDLTPFPPETHPVMESMRTGQPCKNVVMGVKKGDGALSWISINSQPLFREGANRPYAVVASFAEITEHKRFERELKHYSAQLRALSAHLQSVREEERGRIAREIHDELGQALTGLKMEVAWLDKRLAQAEGELTRPLLAKTRAISMMLDAMIQTVRKIATDLRPGVLDALGLTAAIEWQIQEFRARTGINCQVRVAPEPLALDPERATAVFRIFQEILTNITRHAEATRVLISLDVQGGDLLLRVKDNGKGIPELEVSRSHSLGLLGMRERALLLGGEVRIRGAARQGTTVTVRIPLATGARSPAA